MYSRLNNVHVYCHSVQFISCLSLPSDAFVNIVQDPDPVQVGKNVTLTCNATAVRNITELKWIDTAANNDFRSTDDSVVDLQVPALGVPNVSSVLVLFVNNKKGDNWAMNAKCTVELESASESSGANVYKATYKVKVADGRFCW